MKRTFILILISILTSLAAFAQGGFMEHVQSKVQGQGTVTVLQDQRLTNIINGDEKIGASVSVDKKTDDDIPVIRTGKKVKVRGYRIQVYWGGSQRADQSNALREGSRVTNVFPELQAYTSFESPHWRCRVGDFVNRQEAADYLRKLREANIGRDAMIVRSEIYIYQQ